jgi:alkaline phosphatase D
MARYLPNKTGTLLGKEQWAWLKSELKQSKADLHIIGMSIQLIAEEQGYEKWANFPVERERFFKLLAEVSTEIPTLIISGDRHIAELSKIEIQGLNYPLYDLTASGLTHTWGMAWPEPNQHRIDSLIVSKNFGLLDISFPEGSPIVNMQVQNELGKVLLDRQISY